MRALILLLSLVAQCAMAQSTTSPYRPAAIVPTDTATVPQPKQEIAIAQRVDLGLSVYWAGCNSGATAPQNGGKLLTHDAARNVGTGGWRLPSRTEMQELINRCRRQWITYNGRRGYKLTGPNGTSIFLPAAGYSFDGKGYGSNTTGYYWTSTQGEDGVCHLFFDSENFRCDDIDNTIGYSVRLVADK